MSEQRVVLVTGSTDGIGLATARALAAGGASVIVHGRSKPKVEGALEKLRGELPGATLDGVAFDLGNLSSVRRGAEEILTKAPALHVLVNNAGIFANERVLTADKIELTFAVNCVGPFLLTELLMPRLLASAGAAPSRVIDVASMAHARGAIKISDLELATGWSGYGAYAMSKLANVMHALSLADKHPAEQLVAYSLHPGVISTKLLRGGFGPVQGASLESGARTSVRLAASTTTDQPSGTYFSDGVATPPSHGARDPQVRVQLWDAMARLAKLQA
jgi:NAD(P)-dependent dehydrogenase (short-subunit alcohol dehydrogenase family)